MLRGYGRLLLENRRLKDEVERLTNENTFLSEIVKNAATLISIERRTRLNYFTFHRNGKIHVVDTMGTWDDDIAQWKTDLLEPIDNG